MKFIYSVRSRQLTNKKNAPTHCDEQIEHRNAHAILSKPKC